MTRSLASPLHAWSQPAGVVIRSGEQHEIDHALDAADGTPQDVVLEDFDDLETEEYEFGPFERPVTRLRDHAAIRVAPSAPATNEGSR